MKGNNGSAAQVTNPPKKRKRGEENSIVAQPQQPAAASTNPVTPPPAAASTNPTTPPPAKRLKINGVPAVSNTPVAPASSSSSSSSSARNAGDMPSSDDLFNDAMDVDSAPNSGGNEMPASASTSSSSAEPNIKKDPFESFSQDPLDLLSGAAIYDTNAVMPEQSADQPSTPPILLSAALKDVKDIESFVENLQKIKDLVARYERGAEVISVGLTDAQKSVFLAAIIEYATSDKATDFLRNHVENSQKSKVLFIACRTIASMFSTRALDIILQNDSVQLNLKDIRSPNLLHFAAENKDGGKMISHIFSKLSADDRKAMLAATDSKGNTPLMEAAALGDVQGFDLLMENGQSLKDINKNHNVNLLHLAAQNKDGGKMLLHILSKLSAEDKKAMLAATDSKGNTPLMSAAGMGDDKGFDLLMENGQSLRDIKNNNNSNLLHLAAQNKDCGVMISHILSKLSAEDKKTMLAEKNRFGNTPLMQAAGFGDAKGFEALQSVTENWRQNAEILKRLVLATQKNAEFKKHFEENYPNEYKSGQGIANGLPKAPAPRAAPQQAPQQVVPAPRAASPTIAPLTSSSAGVAAAQQAPLAQTAMSVPELMEALKKALSKEVQTSVSVDMIMQLGGLQALYKKHEGEKESSASRGK